MGLDMYLEAEAHLSNWFEPFKTEPKPEVVALAEGMKAFAVQAPSRPKEQGPHEVVRQLRKLLDSVGMPSDNAGEGNYGSIDVTVQAGYWRKANAIHAWFVKNVQGGVDECQTVRVEREQLALLRQACKDVLADPTLAKELLPSQEGFFFGGTDYDEDYFDDIKHTIKVCNKALEAPDYISYSYRSSW